MMSERSPVGVRVWSKKVAEGDSEPDVWPQRENMDPRKVKVPMLFALMQHMKKLRPEEYNSLWMTHSTLWTYVSSDKVSFLMPPMVGDFLTCPRDTEQAHILPDSPAPAGLHRIEVQWDRYIVISSVSHNRVLDG